jgi:hypothetical protein
VREDDVQTPTSQDSVVAAAASERRTAPTTAVEAADLADKYDRMMRLADLFDDSGEEMRQRAKLGAEVINDPAFAASEEVSKATHGQAEDDIRAATTGKHGLLTRSIELDADALVLRATVLTYRWIDELQNAAYETLGSIAGRAIGYLAPEVALGGAIVSAGLIETDALDRDGVAAYLSELAESNPELMEHVTSGGGGLLDGLQMRSILTAGVLAGDRGRLAAQGGLRAAGIDPLSAAFGAAVRDIAGGLVQSAPVEDPVTAAEGDHPRTLAELMSALETCSRSVTVQRIADGRYIAYLTGPDGGSGRRLRLVGGDQAEYAAHVVRTIEDAVAGDPGAHVMLVGSAQGGVAAAEVAAKAGSDAFVIDQVVTAGAPSAHVPRIPESTRVLSLEDRADPVALLGSLINAGSSNRVTVVFDGAGSDDENVYVAGGKAADQATHPQLREEIARIHELGYLAG